MARRTGKAATRRARQQKRARQGPAPAAPISPPAAAEESAEAITAETTPSRPTGPRSKTPVYAGVATSSRLGEEARQEYHYVVSDLRNTGVLVLIMAAMLAVAVVVVNVVTAAP